MITTQDLDREWLETDGLGGFSSGTIGGERTRRYHGLLLAATTPPTGRMLLVSGFDAHVTTPNGRFAITRQRYAPDTVHPDGAGRLSSFANEPWPRWHFRLEDGTTVEQDLFVTHGAPRVVVRWRLIEPRARVMLEVRPFVCGRDYHALHHANPSFRFHAEQNGGEILWRPYQGVPGVRSISNGVYRHEPCWYRRFLYAEERARGLDFLEDLAAPGILQWDLSAGAAVWILGTEDVSVAKGAADAMAQELAAVERQRRSAFPSPLHRAADAYVVRRGEGQTIVAGYPWFTDWGRDTFLSLRGLCLATGCLDVARRILLEWSGTVSQGMLPNRFPDRGEAPEYNSVDAALWFVVVAQELRSAMTRQRATLPAGERKRLEEVSEAILAGYAAGTRHGIRMDDDALLAAGEPGVQLTWMDARVGDRVITPRIGKPVEVQALWLSALAIGGAWSRRWKLLAERGRAAFARRFWNAQAGHLHDVVDVDHRIGVCDATLRPNQILAVGGLPHVLLDLVRARAVVEVVEARLLTPLGLRSLAPGERGYVPRYEGDVAARDSAYHQGPVWPWLLGPFVEAWLRVRGSGASAKQAARTLFLAPILQQMQSTGVSHLCEIADAEAPYRPRGCPFQAWSLGEVIRLSLDVLADERPVTMRRGHRSRTSRN